MRGRRGKRELTLKNGSLNPPQWIKRRGGKSYLFRGSYEEAVKQWHVKLVQIEAEEEAEEAAKRQAPPPPPPCRISLALSAIVDRVELPEGERGAFRQATLPHAPLPSPTSKKTVSGAIALFLELKRTEAEAESISLARWNSLRVGLNRFQEWYAPRRSLAEITGATLTEYWQYLAGEVRERRIKAVYAKERLQMVRQFVVWAWENDLIKDLPRNIHSRSLRFSVPAEEVTVFTLEELRRVLNVTKERERLYVLLALNCGMTSIDISDLHPSEVNWEEETITRKRSKTRKHQNAPVVRYQLWPETLELLRKCASDNPDHLLLNRDGRPLNRWIGKDGERPRHTDAISRTLDRILARMPEPKIKGNFKKLRKTGATLLDRHPEHSRFRGRYLAHAPAGIAERHYIGADQEGFDRAMEWLREQITVAKNSET